MLTMKFFRYVGVLLVAASAVAALNAQRGGGTRIAPGQECPPGTRPWDAFYLGSTLIVHGHWGKRGAYRTDRVIGLDSGCVYGGRLTAWCQEEDRTVSVPSRGRA